MFDELMLPDTATLSPAKNGIADASLRVRLPWYRSLPISCIEQIALTVDGKAIARDDLTISVGDVRHSLDEAATLHDVSWFVLDQAVIRFPVATGLSPGVHQVGLSMTLRIPYTEPEYWAIDFTQTAVHSRSIEFVGGDPMSTFKLGVTLYSFNADYYTYRYSLQDCFAAAGSLGPGQGVEIVGPQMIRGFPELSSEFEHTFRRLVDLYGLQPSAYGAYSDRGRVTGRLCNRDEQIEYLQLQIRSAARLGFPVIRTQVAEVVINDLVPYAEKYGVKMAMEIHAPMTIEVLAPAIERVQKINSPYLGFAPDTGVFCHSPATVYIDRFREQGVPASVIDHIVDRWRDQIPVEQMRKEVAALNGGELGDLMALESEVYFGHGDPSSLEPLMPHIVHVHGSRAHVLFIRDRQSANRCIQLDGLCRVFHRSKRARAPLRQSQ